MIASPDVLLAIALALYVLGGFMSWSMGLADAPTYGNQSRAEGE